MNETASNLPLDSLYQEVILDHHRDPRNRGELPDATIQKEGFNPLCGDRVQLALKLSADAQTIEQVRYQGEGCSICMASASMMAESIEGISTQEALSQIQNFRNFLQGDEAAAKPEGDLESLAGVRKFPVRIKCAILPWTTLKQAIEEGASS